jgi:hypothetical protein
VEYRKDTAKDKIRSIRKNFKIQPGIESEWAEKEGSNIRSKKLVSYGGPGMAGSS